MDIRIDENDALCHSTAAFVRSLVSNFASKHIVGQVGIYLFLKLKRNKHNGAEHVGQDKVLPSGFLCAVVFTVQ